MRSPVVRALGSSLITYITYVRKAAESHHVLFCTEISGAPGETATIGKLLQFHLDATRLS